LEIEIERDLNIQLWLAALIHQDSGAPIAPVRALLPSFFID